MIKPIRTKKDYQIAVRRIYELMQADLRKNSKEYDELDILTILVENYEREKFPIGVPDPVEAIRFRMEQLELTASDLAKILGSASRASEILSRKRKLSLSMIRTLNKKLNIPVSALISDY